jgi:hypothetical protein
MNQGFPSRTTLLSARAIGHCRHQLGATGGQVPLERDGNAIDENLGVSFRDHAYLVALDGAKAAITHACNRYPHDRAVRRGSDDLTAVASGIVQAYNAAHGNFPSNWFGRPKLF